MGNKKKQRNSVAHSNSDLSKNDGDFVDSPPKNIKKSVSYSGNRSNPFSIMPDNFSDNYDSDDNYDKENFDEIESISQFAGGESRVKRVNSNWSTSDYGSNFDDVSSITENSRFENVSTLDASKSSKKQKKKRSKSEKSLQMYDEKFETTQLPSKDDVNEIFSHLKLACQKSWDVFMGVLSWIAVKFLAIVVIIIQFVLQIFRYIWIVIVIVIYYLSKGIIGIFLYFDHLLLKTHDRRDPFKRHQNNLNMKRMMDIDLRDISDYDINMKSIRKKRLNLVLDLDETLVYVEPYKQKTKEKIDISSNPDIVQVTHPIQKQVQIFTLKKRPFLDIFLLEMSKFFNLIIYSEAQKQYVDSIVDKIDTNKLISKRLYRDDCIKCPGLYIKDLQHAGNMQNTIVLDKSEDAVKLDKANSLIINAFRGQENDQELSTYAKILTFIVDNSIKKNITLFDSLHFIKENYL